MTIFPNLTTTPSAADALAARESMLKSLSRLSGGAQSGPAQQAEAETTATPGLNEHTHKLAAAQQQVGNALSLTQTRQAYLAQMSRALERMSELAASALNEGASAADRGRYHTEFAQLSTGISNLAGRSFNGSNLFNGTNVAVTADSMGEDVELASIDFSQPIYSDALQSRLDTVAEAQMAALRVGLAWAQLRRDAAGVDADCARLMLAADQLSVSRENLNAVASPLRESGAAEASAQFARDNIVTQPGAALRAQANATPQRVLRLLP